MPYKNKKDLYGYSRVYNIESTLEYKQTEHYSNLIKWLVRLTNCQSYLELGVDDGKNIYLIREHVDKCVGVDIFDRLSDKNKIEYNLMSTDEFFNKNDETFDIIFIDANHGWRYVRRDFENSLKILNEFGIIFLHDTDPIHEVMIQFHYCSDSYHINDYIYANHPELDIITLPVCDMGLSIVKRKNDKRISKFL